MRRGTLAIAVAASIGAGASGAPRHLPVFDEITRLVADEFYDPDLHGLDWPALTAKRRALAAAAPDDDAFALVVNDLLAALEASHTAYYTADDQRYAEVLDIFRHAHEAFIQARFGDAGVRTETIGARIERVGDGESWFVTDLLAGAPAAHAGLLIGDEILTADGEPFHPVRSFRGRAASPVRLAIRREGPGAPPRSIVVTPVLASPQAMHLASIGASAAVVERDGRRLGYVRMFSWAGEDLHGAFLEALRAEPLASADGLVLDIRGGWGGAAPEYLDVFNADAVPPFTMTLRGGEPMAIDDRWRRPVALLIDGGSRSGKEILAYGFRRARLGPIVGARSAGAVLGGRLFALSDGSLLYLAVGDVVVAGERLEGVGVAPDTPVERSIPYAGGRDAQLEAAFDALIREIP